MTILIDILIASGVLVLCLLLMLAGAFGFISLTAPERAQRIRGFANRRVSTRRALKWAEWPYSIERHFYHHHKIYGALLLITALLSLTVLWTRIDPSQLAGILAGKTPHRLWLDVVLTTGYWLLIVGSALSCVLSLLIILRPSLLKRAEQRSNRWLSTRQAARKLERSSDVADRRFETAPRLAGALILAASVILLAMLWPVAAYLLKP